MEQTSDERKIEPPCGCGDIIPVYVRGHWIYTSYCQDFRDYVDGKIPGFTVSQLAKMGLLDRSSATSRYDPF